MGKLLSEIPSAIETASTASSNLVGDASSVSALKNWWIQIFGSSRKLACELSQRRCSAQISSNPSAEALEKARPAVRRNGARSSHACSFGWGVQPLLPSSMVVVGVTMDARGRHDLQCARRGGAFCRLNTRF